MTKNDFYNQHPISKMDYIISCLYRAKSLFATLYNSACYFDDKTLKELEHLGDEFTRIGYMAENQEFHNIYEDLQASLSRLSNIVSVVEYVLNKDKKIN